MARYFFNVHDGEDSPDQTGVELSSMAQVRAEAIRASSEMLRDCSAGQWNGTEWKMTVTDESDRTVFLLNFSASEPTE